MTILIAALVGAGGFFGGMQYQKSHGISGSRFANGSGGTFNRQFTGGNGQFMQRGSQSNRPVSGEIISSDGSSITVKMQDGSTKIIVLDSKTMINKSEAGTKDDLKNGEKVTAFGTANSDRSVTAQFVSLGDRMMFRGGGGTPPQGGTMQKQN